MAFDVFSVFHHQLFLSHISGNTFINGLTCVFLDDPGKTMKLLKTLLTFTTIMRSGTHLIIIVKLD